MPVPRTLRLCLAPLLFSLGCSSSSSGSGPIAAPTLAVSPASLAFGSITLGQSSVAQAVTLANTGAASISLNSVTLSDQTDYALGNPCGATLAAGASCTLQVTFKPQSVATLPATLTVTSNAAGSPQTVAITGTGTAAPVAQATLTPTAIAFPATLPMATSPVQTATLLNSGNAPLTIGGVALAGTNPAAFALGSNTCPVTLAAGASCSVGVTFTPPAASSTYTASLVVTDNAGGVAGTTQTVALSGSSSAAPVAQAVLSATSLTFAGTIAGSSSAAQTVTLSNPGNAPLTAIALSGLSFTTFTSTSTCGTTLPAGSSCTLSVVFTPTSTGSFSGTLRIASSATSSAQTVSLTGTGTAPQAVLSPTTLSFPNTVAGTTSAAQTATLSNPGTAPLTISSIAVGGSTSGSGSAFAETTTCTGTLAVGASCSITVTYTPATGTTSSTGAVTVMSNAANSPQTLALTGSTPVSSSQHTLYTFPESDGTVTPLYALVNGASKTIDMTMYELVDTTFSADLVSACTRGVRVRVILDASLEKSSNTAAYNQLNAAGANCSAAWSNTQFQATHQKTLIVDGTQAAIMSLNLTSRYYSTTRDFALVENDPVDIAAIQSTFNTDYGSTTDFSYQPGAGTDLIWSPTTAQPNLLALINGATKTLLVENEEMSAANIVSALEAACGRGVQVHIAMTDTGSYHANYSALEAAGCGVHTYPNTTTGLYIHAKAMVADYGLSTQQVYLGSINFSNASMTQNRELGLYVTDAASVSTLNTVLTQDYAGANPY